MRCNIPLLIPGTERSYCYCSLEPKHAGKCELPPEFSNVVQSTNRKDLSLAAAENPKTSAAQLSDGGER